MRKYDYFIASLVEIKNDIRKNLVETLGDAKAVFFAKESTLVNTGLLDLDQVALLKSKAGAFDLGEYENAKSKGIDFISIWDKEYPKRLKTIFDAPYGLFVKGKIPDNIDSSVSIIGARRCSAYGRLAAETIGEQLAKRGVTIVSGMARGADTAGHIGALRGNGKTVAVLGCGVDVCYPKENYRIYEKIPENGAVISEYIPKTAPLQINFPNRNRIISGLSTAVIIVEAAKRSGTLITADLALDQGRDVFALPGRITDDLSEGCNKIIKEGAGIISSIDDLIETFVESGIIIPDDEKDGEVAKKAGIYRLKGDEKRIYNALKYTPLGIDELILSSKRDFNTVIANLESLIDKGLIRQEGKNRYVKNTLRKISR